MRRIIVGMDGSAGSSAALRWAAKLAVPLDAEIVAINAFANPYSEVPFDDHERMIVAREHRLATTWTDPARHIGARVTCQVRNGDPRNEVLGAATDERADLVVLGRTGDNGGPGFLHLGSVVEHAAHHLRCALAVIPPYVTGAVERVVLGVDGSVESQSAVEWCAEHAAAVHAEVLAVSVFEPDPWEVNAESDQWRADIEQRVASWTTPLHDARVEMDTIAQRDLHPADALVGIASARHADLLVAGMRGAGGFWGLRAGGVAMKLLHRAQIPLVLVPPGTPE
jgi:nucleotide-binding universal stress UspA family protein